ncbi:hypothetical protein E1809_08045 [Arthrobacter terricola]|uniref:Uncharacterized protein n=1 Tax=Arthrobacter terricola TaxID=2547396 RepID=A0A4R5KP04_9MICC|nr:hypothetical protein E1809_08045 [Arthrobacter terricola]
MVMGSVCLRLESYPHTPSRPFRLPDTPNRLRRGECTKILKSVLRPASDLGTGRAHCSSQMNLLLRKCRNRLAQRRWVHICVLTN